MNYDPRGTLDTRPVKARPGAYGYGMDVVGGRGGTLYVVDSLDCTTVAGDGKITFREVWEKKGDVKADKRIVAFAVGGLSKCGNAAILSLGGGGHITILGQTAPSPGFQVAALQLSIKHVSQVNLQHFQVLGTDPSGKANPSGKADAHPLAASGRGVGITASSSDTHDVFLGNMSFLNYTDDSSSWASPGGATGEIYNITYQDLVAGEGDACSSHPESWCAMDPSDKNYAFRKKTYYHAFGLGFLGPDNRTHDVSMIGSLSAHAGFRNPIVRGITRFELIGNVGYNCVAKGFDFWAGPSDGYVYDNVAKRGPNSDSDCWQVTGTRVEALRNKLVAKSGAVSNAPELKDKPKNFSPTVASWKFDDRCLGPIHRDANLDRIIQEMKTGTGEVGIGAPYGNPLVADGDAGRHWEINPKYYPSTSHPAGWDTDGDGMQDAWELANGLKVGAKDHNDDKDGDGYTNLEEYAAFMARFPTTCPQ